MTVDHTRTAVITFSGEVTGTIVAVVHGGSNRAVGGSSSAKGGRSYHIATDKDRGEAGEAHEEAMALLKRRRVAEAKKCFRRAITLDPTFPHPLQNLAGIYYQEGDYDEAVKLLRQAVDTDPGYAAAFFTWGNLSRDRRDYGDADVRYAKAVNLRPDWAEAYYNWGLSCLQAGDKNEAVRKFRTAVQLKPGLRDLFRDQNDENNWGLKLD